MLVVVFALLQACASAQPGAGPADASTVNAADASGKAAADATAEPAARAKPEENVKVMIYKSREALGLLDALVPKKFHFEVYMLVGIGEAVDLPDAKTPKKKAIKIPKAEELEAGDPAELVQSLPAGTFYQKLAGKMLVIVHLVKDARDLPGVCPEGTPPKPAAPPVAADPPVILWRVPVFDGPIDSAVLETVLPCPPLPKPAANPPG